MKTLTIILLVLTILSLFLMIGGIIAYELGHKSNKEHEKKIGLGLIISGSILTILFLISTIVVHTRSKKSKKQSNSVNNKGETKGDQSENVTQSDSSDSSQ